MGMILTPKGPLVGPDGRPLATATTDPALRGGWIQSGGLGAGSTLPTLGSLYGVDRPTERRASRVAYFLNPAYWAALEVVKNYVVGDAFTYGDLDDKTAQAQLDEFWAENNLGRLVDRFWTEFSLDGENATVWVGKLRRGAPARIAFLDVDAGLELTADTLEGVTRLKAHGETYEQGLFVWTAHDSLYNDPRGWPPFRHAVAVAIAYVALLNHRLRLQDVQSRLNAVYYALVDAGAGDGGLAQQTAKAAVYGRIPSNGAVVTLAKDRETGESEELKFLDVGKGAQDAQHDMRQVRLLLSMVMGLPEHYLGEGGNVTRTTADAMGDPARRSILRKHAAVRDWLDRVYRTELIRRNGRDKRYSVRQVSVRHDGLTRIVSTRRVPAAQVEVPWVFPNVSTDDLEALVKKVDLAARRRLASTQTLMGELGYDPALERERLAAEGTTPNPEPAVGREEGDAS